MFKIQQIANMLWNLQNVLKKIFNTVPLLSLSFPTQFSNNVVTQAGIVYNQAKHIILRKIKR